MRTPVKIGLTAHVLSRLGDRRPTALDGVKAIPDSWEDEEHRLIGFLEEVIRRCNWGLLTAAYDLHLESISVQDRGEKGDHRKSAASLEMRCRALHRALDDLK